MILGIVPGDEKDELGAATSDGAATSESDEEEACVPMGNAQIVVSPTK